MFPTCSQCGLLMGDRITHENWHRELEAKILRASMVTPLANWRQEEC